MNHVSVIFPIAGMGSRFGYTFKPFLKATEDTFIELAKKPFDLLEYYGYSVHYYFICRESQERTYHVSDRLQQMFPKDWVTCLTIRDEDTDGPLQTVQQAVSKYHLKGMAFVCDCDHSIQIEPMLENMKTMVVSGKVNVMIPTWNIEKKDYIHWGKVKIGNDGEVLDFCEKEDMSQEDGEVKGLIGCYLFRQIDEVCLYPAFENISSMLKQMLLEGKRKMVTIPIQEADFYGTPKSLQDFRFKRAKKYTLFMDVDGTLIHQTTKRLLPGTLDKLHYWKSQGHKIILTTASDGYHRTEMMKRLREYQIPYDELLTGLPPGPRFVVNDRKPYLPYYCMAGGIVLDRDQGIGEIELPTGPPEIIHLLKGASFAHVYLVEDPIQHKLIVRKYIPKTRDLMSHADILKRQCEDMRRMYFYKKGICPKILSEYESPSEYYYDMEYLKGYDTLSQASHEDLYTILPTILKDLDTDIYGYRKPILPNARIGWVQDYLEEKVFPKFKLMEDLHPDLQHLIHLENVVINHKSYRSLQDYLQTIPLDEFGPEYTCPIHGDLTLENILYHPETKDYKLIDPAGARYMDAVEMDTAKLFQSLVCDYASWAECAELVKYEKGGEGYTISERYLQDAYPRLSNLYTKEQYRRGIFYMSTYFIRMVPYMLHKSLQHAIFILLLAIHHMDSLFTKSS